MEVTGPGTAPNGLPNLAACRAVLSAPDRQAASTTTVAWARAAINLFRVKNRARVGAEPGGCSLITSPVSADRKSTRLNSSHVAISYAVFCLKKKKTASRRDTKT